jgi:HEPN domain-containing protein
MWNDITRGVAALKSAWSFDSVVSPADAATVCSTEDAPDFLREAESYIESGRHHSAAILAGDALESTLRKLCAEHSLDPSSVDSMNAELARKGIYGDNIEQRLRAAADLRDKANCGLWSEVSKDDVEAMVAEVRAFAAQYAHR